MSGLSKGKGSLIWITRDFWNAKTGLPDAQDKDIRRSVFNPINYNISLNTAEITACLKAY